MVVFWTHGLQEGPPSPEFIEVFGLDLGLILGTLRRPPPAAAQQVGGEHRGELWVWELMPYWQRVRLEMWIPKRFEPMNGQPLTILHVEDNSDHAQLIARTLRKNRVVNAIHHVVDGQEALDYLFVRGKYTSTDLAPRPQIILLDLRLPKVDGLEVLKTIKNTDALSAIPVVILTSSEAEKDVAQAYQYHANSYLVKPVEFEQFSELMQQLGFYWLAWNRYPWQSDPSDSS